MLKSCSQIVLGLCLVFSTYGKNLPTATVRTHVVKSDVDSTPLLCNPPPRNDAAHYIVGYGSLMESASKERTYKNTGENIPVQIKGFRREWNLKGDSIGLDTTYLGVVPHKDSSFNGVIFQLPPSENVVESLKSYDVREKFYCRQNVDIKDIKVLAPLKESSSNSSATQEKYYWIYVNKEKYTARPTKGYPIVQSYVDVFISGCLELQEKFNLPDFAKKCVESTEGWSAEHWVNDRIYPRRPFVHQSKAGKIDKVLQDAIPIEFENIRIEG